MGLTRTLLDNADAEGILSFPLQAADNDVYTGRRLDEASAWIEAFSGKARGRTTLFLGAAISTFKPAQLPMWNDFVELLWTSALQFATEPGGLAPGQPSGSPGARKFDLEQASSELLKFFAQGKKDVPNYMITEVVSRRLGQQYLQVLDAFQAEQMHDGSFACNAIHKWAAELLATGGVASVMTTNFDNYLEKAIENTTSLYYQITGDPHVDGTEISSLLLRTTARSSLVLIVNGAKAFEFVRSLMPQLGAGRVTFLFKIHGSCYDPVSCIDTRLQRAQGLPSFATDVLDILLKRTVWLVAGFSGSDMNDNLDYLRFISSKREASILWLTYPNAPWEKAIHGLQEAIAAQEGSSTGLCLLSGHFLGHRNFAGSKFPRFEQKIRNWAQDLGPDWCKLLLIDLAALFEEKSGRAPPGELLQMFNQGDFPRQDWNLILQNMDLKVEESQVLDASLASRTSG
jgi:hypothetical protein